MLVSLGKNGQEESRPLSLGGRKRTQLFLYKIVQGLCRKSRMSAPTKRAFSCGPGEGEKLLDLWASGRKGQECPQEIRAKKFMFLLLFLPRREGLQGKKSVAKSAKIPGAQKDPRISRLTLLPSCFFSLRTCRSSSVNFSGVVAWKSCGKFADFWGSTP